MSVSDVILNRRSIRKFEQKPVEEEKLFLIREAGRLSPSASNKQNWKFVLVTEKGLLVDLAEACNSQMFVAEAPAAIVVCATGDRSMGCGQSAATVDCSIAMASMMIQATELGLGTCWLGSFNPTAVKLVLDLPESYIVVAVSPLGYPAEAPAARPRKTSAEVWLER